jgi:hypothetical protein
MAMIATRNTIKYSMTTIIAVARTRAAQEPSGVAI